MGGWERWVGMGRIGIWESGEGKGDGGGKGKRGWGIERLGGGGEGWRGWGGGGIGKYVSV